MRKPAIGAAVMTATTSGFIFVFDGSFTLNGFPFLVLFCS